MKNLYHVKLVERELDSRRCVFNGISRPRVIAKTSLLVEDGHCLVINLVASAEYQGIEWWSEVCVLSENHCALIDCVCDHRRFTKESSCLLGIIAVFRFLDKIESTIDVAEQIAIYLDPYF